MTTTFAVNSRDLIDAGAWVTAIRISAGPVIESVVTRDVGDGTMDEHGPFPTVEMADAEANRLNSGRLLVLAEGHCNPNPNGWP